MIPVHTYTALLDVLSYKYRLEKDQKDGTLSFKDDLENALKIFDSIDNDIFHVRAISDTIILTSEMHDNFIEFLIIMQKVFFTFLESGLFIRGGIAYSRHFENGRLTYSHAIARAYDLENKSAIYPRILIDSNIIEMYKSGTDLPEIFNKQLIVKQNGVYFLNVVGEDSWETIYTLAAKIYAEDKQAILFNEAAFAKHQWFENYLFNFKPQGANQVRYIQPMLLV